MVRLLVFDGGIHHGVIGNNKIMQRALNRLDYKIAVDGVVGPMTLAAVP